MYDYLGTFFTENMQIKDKESRCELLKDKQGTVQERLIVDFNDAFGQKLRAW